MAVEASIDVWKNSTFPLRRLACSTYQYRVKRSYYVATVIWKACHFIRLPTPAGSSSSSLSHSSVLKQRSKKNT